MRIAIMGSGGVGGYFGARLAAAGNDVTFIARGAHLDAIRASGLIVKSLLGDVTIKPAKAVVDPASIDAVDAIMFGTKMGDTEAAARQLSGLVAKSPATTVFTFQNGVESADRIEAVLGRGRVVPGVARIATQVEAPGIIAHTSKFARLEMGEQDGSRSDRVTAFHAACKAASIDAVIVDSINRALWIKFAMLAPFSGMTTLTGSTVGPLRSEPGTRALFEAAIREVVAVGVAAGKGLTPADAGECLKTIDGIHDTMTTSMAHDRAAGKPLELDGLSGAVVRLGERHGVATPTHRFIAQALSIAAKGKAAVG